MHHDATQIVERGSLVMSDGTGFLSECPHRRSHALATSHPTSQAVFVCDLATNLLPDHKAARGMYLPVVEPSHCNCCNNQSIPALPELNPVVASVVFQTAIRIAQAKDLPASLRWQAWHSQQFAQHRLAHCLARNDDPLTSQATGPSISLASKTSSHQVGRPRIGLVGFNSLYGLGQVNRDLVKQLSIDRWLVPDSPRMGKMDPERCEVVSRHASRESIERWMEGLNVVLFVEQPPFENLMSAARRSNVAVICIPNWEWLNSGQPWVSELSGMICPTQHTYSLVESWRTRFGFTFANTCVPWPIDIDRYAYKERFYCNRFLYVGGRGGYPARDVDNVRPDVCRKGLQLILQVARWIPESQWTIVTEESVIDAPRNVRIIRWIDRAEDLYPQGDVCVQPSYWEGTGLPLLECQAAGLPLITVDCPPMNEYRPWLKIPVVNEYFATLDSSHNIVVPEIDATKLAELIRAAIGCDIRYTSQAARQYIADHHNWHTARDQILQAINTILSSYVS